MQTLRDPHRSPVVLVVEPDPVERERYGAWPEEAGMTPINCPGQPITACTCLGVRGERCALAAVADIVVLNATGLPAIKKPGTAGWRLLRYYLAAGKPVVVIADNYRKDRSFRPEQVAVLRPKPGSESLKLAVRMMLREAQRW